MDMAGRILHTWRYPFQKVWPDRDTKICAASTTGAGFIYSKTATCAPSSTGWV